MRFKSVFRACAASVVERARHGALFAAACTVAMAAQSQSTGGADLDANQQRLVREREAALREVLQQRPDVRLPAVGAASAQALPTDEAPCFTIRQLELRGSEAGRFGWLIDATAGPGMGDSPLRKCLGARGVGLAIKRAQDALVSRGFVTSRVLAEPQDLSSGTLVLTVLPGRIRHIRFKEASQRASAWNASPARAGDILNLRDIEQALENFKRVPTVEADIQITPAEGPGAAPGQSDLVIAWTQRPIPFRLSLGADDSGSKATGKYQGSLTLSHDNGLTLNDLFYVTLNHDLGGANPGGKGTRGHAAHYSVPYGYWLLSLNASGNRYFQTVAGASQDYVYSGTSASKELELRRLLHRDASSKTGLSLKAFARRSSNFIDDTEVQVQQRRVGGWQLGVSHKVFVGAATVDLGLDYKRGTGAFGAVAAPEEAFGEGTSRFALISANASVQAPFELGGRPWHYSGQWKAQFDRTPLTPQDRFAIGGRYTVRGFDGESSLSAPRGWLVRHEVSTALGDSGQAFFIGVDHGQVGGPGSELLVGRRLSGAVIGLRGRVQDASYDVFVGGPLSQPSGFKTASVTGGFNLNWSY